MTRSTEHRPARRRAPVDPVPAAGDGGPEAAILGLLRRDALVSGAALSAALGVTRAAVWKHVQQLRRQGYRIAALRSRGYRLVAAPDRLLAAEIAERLTTGRIGRALVALDETVSTNADAARLARAGAREGTLVVAEKQTGGRGRLGRAWVSPPYVNLYASVVLRPAIAPQEAPLIGLVAAVAAARALEPLAPGRVAIKWPNDCLLDGRKVVGILTEMEAELDRVRAVVLGIGVNLNGRRFPAAIRATATSVRLATGRRVDRVAFVAALCREIEAVYDRFVQGGFAAVRDEWNGYSCLTGRTVTIDGGGRRSEGTVRGLDTDGRLVLEAAGGVERIVAGDVTVVGAARPGRVRTR